MSLLLRQLHIRVTTSAGLYGVRLSFSNGLVILRAENTTGKSTCLLAIIYALGLERMLGPTADLPLPHALTGYIEDSGKELLVIESEVLLEISNGKGQALTIQRGVIGTRDTRLVTVWEGDKLSNPDSSPLKHDYFLRDPGSATHAAGFHNKLTDFLGWQLPIVNRFNGTECPLYLEAIFPLFIVEQKHGWSGIQANLPTFLGIREAGKRALEFVLNVDGAKIIQERQALEEEQARLINQWKNLITASTTSVRVANGRLTGIPDKPTAEWPLAIPPQIEVFRGEKWLSATDAQRLDRQDLQQLEMEPVATVGELAGKLSEELNIARENLSEKDALASMMLDDVSGERMQLKAIEVRLAALQDDLERNQDAAKLKTFGSVAKWSVNEQSCPTCHQSLTDALLPQRSIEKAMSVEDNIVFIQNQISSFEKLADNSKQILKLRESELLSLRQEIDSLRAKIRAIRQSLVSPDSTPSVESIRQRLDIEGRIRVLDRTMEEFQSNMDVFSEISENWKKLQGSLNAVGKLQATDEDRRKINRFQTLLREQLHEFTFSSVKADSIEISPDSYRPIREGFNLGFDLSASDNIRIIWAYLEGILELVNEFDMHHPNLLIFDEPRQQEAKPVSFQSLLRRTSKAKNRNQQVLFFTSEPLQNILEMTANLDVQVIAFDGWVLKKM